MKLLVAEDDEGELELYRIAFQSKGHQVVLTRNGKECLDAYRKAIDDLQKGETVSRYVPFDAIVLDYRMPIIDELEAAKEIIRLNKNKG